MTLLNVLDHPIWYNNVFFYLFILSLIAFSFITYKMMRGMKVRATELKLTQQQHVAKVDIIRKEHSDTLEKIRHEMLKREEERGRQWMESEKEVLHVLNGVTNVFEISEKFGRVESNKIIERLGDVETKIDNVEKIIKPK